MTFFPQIRFTPMQKIKMDPVKDMSASPSSVRNGSMSFASSVITPWNIPTGIAEKIHPFPMDAVMIATMIMSRTAFAAKIE